MSIPDVLFLVALILALVDEFRARGQSLTGWATLAWFDSRFGTAAWGLAMLDLAYYRARLIDAYEARARSH